MRTLTAVLAVLGILAGNATARPLQDPMPGAAQPAPTPQPSRAVGKPWHGRLEHGTQLPEAAASFFTWDWGLRVSPDRPWRRWGTSELVGLIQQVTSEFHLAHPDVRLGVADLSRTHGGPFGARYGGLGHASHQNGLDVDVLYPRLDRREKPALRPGQVDQVLGQELVDRFLALGAIQLYVGPHLHLTGPRRIVIPLAHHDNHVHVRIANPRARR